MVLEEEDLVDAILLKRAELDKKADRARERLLDNEVLLASDLVGGFRSVRSVAGGEKAHTTNLQPRGVGAGLSVPCR